MLRFARPQVYQVVREMLPRERFGPAELLRWLEATQLNNERASRSHEKRRAAILASTPSHREPLLQCWYYNDEWLVTTLEHLSVTSCLRV